MATTRGLSTTAVLIVCLVGTQWSGTLFASEQDLSLRKAQPSVVNTTTEAEEATSAIPATTVSVGQQRASAKDLASGSPALERSRFTFNDGVLTANAPAGPVSAPQLWRGAVKFVPVESGPFVQRRWGRGRGGRNGAAQAALVLGAVASIAGTALLVYANRPECSANHMANGCGYGTKVVGGAVLSAGIVGVVVGALRWG